MRKKIAKRNFVALTVLAVLLLVFTIFSFNVPFTVQTYNGLIAGFPQSMELKEGVVVNFNAEKFESYDGNYDKSLNELIDSFNKSLSSIVNNHSVQKTGSGIRVHVSNFEDIGQMFSLIEGTGKIEFKSEDSKTASATITAKHIESITVENSLGNKGVLVVFTKEGSNLLKTLSETQLGKQIYMFVGDAEKAFFSPRVDQVITSGSMFISGAGTTDAQANGYALKLIASKLGVSLEIEGEILNITPILGNNTIVYLAIIAGIVFVAGLALLILKFKQLGLVSALNVIFQMVVILLVLNLVPSIQLNFVMFLTLLFAYAIIILNSYNSLKNIHAELLNGKKPTIAFKSSYANNIVSTLDVNAPLFLISLPLIWLFKGSLYGLFVPLALSLLFNTFFNLIVLKALNNMYLQLNSTKTEKMGLKKNLEVQNEK